MKKVSNRHPVTGVNDSNAVSDDMSSEILKHATVYRQKNTEKDLSSGLGRQNSQPSENIFIRSQADNQLSRRET